MGACGDEEAVADLLELNGMPRWISFEERFLVAQKDGKVLGAVRYRTESKRLILGLLVVDPWAGEEWLAPRCTGARESLRARSVPTRSSHRRRRRAILAGLGTGGVAAVAGVSK